MNKVNVISHRGANFFAPQNTLPAFEKAIELNVDGFETDVHLTKDGVPVLCHNYTVNATSDNKGSITNYTLEEIRQFDFGSYFSPSYVGTPIPTVEEFLELFSKSNVKILNIELKSPKDKTETEIVRKTVDLVRSFGLVENLLISSFNPALLVEAKEYEPNCKTGLLYSPDKRVAWTIAKDPIKYAKNIGADALHPHELYVSRNYIERAHAEGLIVNTWTINKPKTIEKMLEWGADGIITNHPDLVQHFIRLREERERLG